MKNAYTEKEINGTYTMVYHTKKAAMEYLRNRRQDMKGCDLFTTGSFYIEYEDGSSVMYSEDMIMDETGKVSASGIFRVAGIVAFEEITENSDTVWNCELACIELDEILEEAEEAAEERNAENTNTNTTNIKEDNTMKNTYTTYIAIGDWMDNRHTDDTAFTVFSARNEHEAWEACDDNDFDAQLIMTADTYRKVSKMGNEIFYWVRDHIITRNRWKDVAEVIIDNKFDSIPAAISEQEKQTAELNGPGFVAVTRYEANRLAMACAEPMLNDEKYEALRNKVHEQREAQSGKPHEGYNEEVIILSFTAEELHMLIERVKEIEGDCWKTILAKLQAADRFEEASASSPEGAEQAGEATSETADQPIWWDVTGRIDASCTVSTGYPAANADEAVKLFLQDHPNCTVEKVEPEPIVHLGVNAWMLDHLIEACEISGKTYLIEEIEKQRHKQQIDLPAHMAGGLKWALTTAWDKSGRTSEWAAVIQKFRDALSRGS